MQLINQFTYRIIVEIFNAECDYSDSLPMIDDISIENDKVNIALHKDDCLGKFVSEWWNKMAKLHSDGVIDDELYYLWIDKQLSEYKDHPINGIPFQAHTKGERNFAPLLLPLLEISSTLANISPIMGIKIPTAGD